MEESLVYILYSKAIDRYYVGVTTGLLSERVLKHNESYYGSRFTSRATDWKVVLSIPCRNFSQARKMELYIKRMKSKKYIQALIEKENEREILLSKF